MASVAIPVIAFAFALKVRTILNLKFLSTKGRFSYKKNFILGASFKQSPNDIGEFRLEKREEIEVRFDNVHPLTLLTIVGKIKRFLNLG